MNQEHKIVNQAELLEALKDPRFTPERIEQLRQEIITIKNRYKQAKINDQDQ